MLDFGLHKIKQSPTFDAAELLQAVAALSQDALHDDSVCFIENKLEKQCLLYLTWPVDLMDWQSS